MKHLSTLGLCVVALCALAAEPLPRAERKDDGGLRQLPLRAIRSPQAAATSDRISPADARSLPTVITIDSQDVFNTFLTVDGNGDGHTWKYEYDYSIGGTACYEGTGVTCAADDWLILPFVEFDSAPGSYSLSLTAKKLYLAETFDVCISPTTNVEDAIVIASFNNVPNSFEVLSADFAVPTAGKYCIMVHATSPSAGISLYVTNINIEANTSEGFTVPFSMVPQPEEARYFTFIDANNDGTTWKYDTSNSGLTYEYNRNNAADDYVLFPEINIPEPGNYKFSWEAKAYGQNAESMEVLIGQGEDPTAFNMVFAEPAVGATSYVREVVVNIPQAGVWRPALHCSSAANLYKLLVKNFKLEATTDALPESLPVNYAGPFNLSASESSVFGKSFILPANARIKVSFESKGAPVAVGFANAPVAEAVNELFTTEQSDDFVEVSKILNPAGEGIRYLNLSSAGNAEVRNVEIRLFTEEDEAYQLPFEMQPTAEEFGEFNVVNANGDASTWTYYDSFGAARYNYSSTEKGDDWLILPAINVASADNMLRFSLNACGMAATLPETFEIWAGRSSDPSEMTLLYTSPEVRTESKQWVEYGFSFAPQWTGITYFAVRATSEPKMFHLFVRDFSIKADGRSAGVPRPVSDLKAEPLDGGSHDARVSFVLPTLTESGETMDGSTQLTAEIKSAKASLTLTGTPGQTLTGTIENGQGEGEISVTVTNGTGCSNEASVSVYTGVHVPAKVTGLTAVAGEDNRTAHLEWTLPEAGADGGYVDPQGVTYTVRHATGAGSYTTAGTVKGECQFDFTIPASYPQEMHYFMIVPSNEAGEGESGNRGLGLVMGRPHVIPATEDLSSGNVELGPVGMSYPDESYTLEWYFDNPALAFDEAANASGRAFVAFTEDPGAARGRLHLPKFDTRTDKGARVVLRVFNFPHFAPTDVYGVSHDAQPVLIGHIEPSEKTGWVEYSLPLPESLINRQWVEVYLDFGFDGTHDDEIWMLDRFGMENYFDVELDLRPVSTHSRVNALEETEWSFLAGNYGRRDITFDVPTLNFTTENGNVQQFEAVEPADRSVTLHTGETVKMTYRPVLDPAFEGDIAYDISIPVEQDGNTSNNYLAGEVSVGVQTEYVVRDLTASRSEGSTEVNLAWTAPSTDWGILYMDNLESWEMGDKIGLFTNYDGDKVPTMKFVGNSYPGMGRAKAWQVFDYADAGFDVIYAGYLGTAKSLLVMGPGDGATPADDWLISPEVKGGTQLTFYVRPLHFAYGSESVEVLVSSTGTDISDFRHLTTYNTTVGESGKVPYWEEVEIDLPEDARYFAIRYISKDIFGLQLDDVIYTPAQAESTDLVYSVIRDGEVIASGLKETSYVDRYDGSATYHVAAEKAYGGLHPLSNRAMVETSGVGSVAIPDVRVVTSAGMLSVMGAGGKSLSVVSAEGVAFYVTDSADSLVNVALPAGVYMVTVGGGDAVKAIVR